MSSTAHSYVLGCRFWHDNILMHMIIYILTCKSMYIYIYIWVLIYLYIKCTGIFLNLLMKHAPSLESDITCCELVGNAGPAPIRVPSLHFLYIVFLRLYNVLSLALLLLEFIEIYWVCEFHKLFQVFSY